MSEKGTCTHIIDLRDIAKNSPDGCPTCTLEKTKHDLTELAFYVCSSERGLPIEQPRRDNAHLIAQEVLNVR